MRFGGKMVEIAQEQRLFQKVENLGSRARIASFGFTHCVADCLFVALADNAVQADICAVDRHRRNYLANREGQAVEGKIAIAAGMFAQPVEEMAEGIDLTR